LSTTSVTSGDTQTFRSKMGTFIFDKGVPLVKAKLIRDSITGQFFNPRSNEPRIRTEKDAEEYARHHLSSSLAEIPFEVHIHPMEDS
jgi:hypothetical protein